jgi:hypothetical protein
MGFHVPRRSSEDAILAHRVAVLARDRGVLGGGQALRAQLVDTVQLVARLAAQLAQPGGEGAVELVIPPGLKSLLLKLAVRFGVAEGLSGSSQVVQVGNEGPAAFGGDATAKGLSGLDGAGGIEQNRGHGEPLC